ncbi:MAG: T9SS type A sorting domain-containing protein [Prevotellaceae bacterium]|jgi:hypothetical protein|nr:T9SS type A sorting domain-containing protein [Prevotellaceae bacterium]
MKKIYLILAAATLLGTQNAGAWGFIAEGWGGPDQSFIFGAYYENGYNQPEDIDTYIVQFDGAKSWFSIGQGVNGNDLEGQQLGFSGFTPALSNQTVVRAAAKWDNNMFASFTAVLPDGKVFVTPSNGSAIEMTKASGSYTYTAIIETAASVTISGTPVNNVTMVAYDDFPEAGKPDNNASLIVPDVPVSGITSNLMKVTYTLRDNRVVITNFVSEICAWNYDYETGTGNPKVAFTWETLANGNLSVKILPHSDIPDDVVSFRAAMNAGNFLINGNGNKFTLVSGGNNSTELIYSPNQPVVYGTQIIYNNLVEYRTTTNGDAYDWSVEFPAYSYGTNCTGQYALKLATPTDVSIDANNTLTFTPVANADNYLVNVSLGSVAITTLQVSASGQTLSLPLNGTFNITVVASDSEANYANSDASAAVTWTHTATGASVEDNSQYCLANLGSGALFSWETAQAVGDTYQIGDMLWTIAGDGAAWRSNGVQAAGFKVAGISGLVQKIGGATDNPQVFRPITGVSIVPGALITYSATTEWLTASNSDAYGNPLTLTAAYVYDSYCPVSTQLATPVDLNLTDNNLIFTGDANAGSFTVGIYLDETMLYSVPNFTSGSTLPVPVNGNFNIKVRAISNSSLYTDSEWSQSIPLTVNNPDETVGRSAVCSYFFNPEDDHNVIKNSDEDAVYLTWITAENGAIIATLEGYDETYKATTKYRADGFVLNDLTIGDLPAGSLVTKTMSEDKLTVTFTPKEGITIPKGTALVYDGYLLYQLLEPDGDATVLDDCYPNLNLTYVYGSTCVLTLDVSENGIEAVGIWRLVSAPFEQWTAGDFGFNNAPRVAIRTMNSTTTNTFTWTTQTNENYSFSQGQAFAYQVSPSDVEGTTSYGNANWNNGILTFDNNHTLAGNFSINIPATGTAKYSLLGNPYTVPINIEDLADNGDIIKVGYYALNDDKGLSFAPHDDEIAAWTGFLAVNNGGGPLSFTKPANALAPAFAAATRERMTVTATNENGSHYTILKRNQYGSSTAIGNFDLDFINGGLLEYPQIFTLKNDVQLGINAINENEENVTVPLGIIADYNGPITLSLAGMDSYNCTVMLTDNLESQPTDLTGLSTYDYPTTIDGSVSARFALHFAPVPTGAPATQTANVQAFVRDGKITVVSSEALQNVTVYSVSGAQVFNAATGGAATYTVSEKLPAGAYLVTARTAKETKTQKVVVCN